MFGNYSEVLHFSEEGPRAEEVKILNKAQEAILNQWKDVFAIMGEGSLASAKEVVQNCISGGIPPEDVAGALKHTQVNHPDLYRVTSFFEEIAKIRKEGGDPLPFIEAVGRGEVSYEHDD